MDGRCWIMRASSNMASPSRLATAAQHRLIAEFEYIDVVPPAAPMQQNYSGPVTRVLRGTNLLGEAHDPLGRASLCLLLEAQRTPPDWRSSSRWSLNMILPDETHSLRMVRSRKFHNDDFECVGNICKLRFWKRWLSIRRLSTCHAAAVHP